MRRRSGGEVESHLTSPILGLSGALVFVNVEVTITFHLDIASLALGLKISSRTLLQMCTDSGSQRLVAS